MEERRGTERMEAFSDGVFAVVATLLVLDLRVPDLPHGATGYAAVGAALLPLGSRLLAFCLSFLFVMIAWVNHHQVMNAIEKVDRTLLWCNNFLLFAICLLPFPTAFFGANPYERGAVMILAISLGLSAMGFASITWHANRRDLFRADIGAPRRAAIRRRSRVGPWAFLGTVGLAALSPVLGICGIFAVMIFYALPAYPTKAPRAAERENT
jgi:uncharacterized membrane protein